MYLHRPLCPLSGQAQHGHGQGLLEADVEPAGHGLQDRVRPRGHRHGQEGASEE